MVSGKPLHVGVLTREHGAMDNREEGRHPQGPIGSRLPRGQQNVSNASERSRFCVL